MKISRKGSFADHGSSSINIDKPIIKWNKSEEVVEFYQAEVNDFTTPSTHNYTIQIPLSEIKKVIEIVGEDPVNEIPGRISKAFSPCLRQLIRLEKTCIGKIGLGQADDVSQNA